jgi:hypothetical protein
LKYLIILLLLLAFWTFMFWRLRPYIKMARRVLNILRGVQQVGVNDTAAPLRAESSGSSKDGERLVRCASCSTWIPAARAVKLRTQSASYCSHECLERAAGEPQRARRSS